MTRSSVENGLSVNFFGGEGLRRKNILRWVLYSSAIIFAFSVFLSKALVNISGALLFVSSILWLFYYNRSFLKQNSWLGYLICLAFVGSISGLFATGGKMVAIGAFLNSLKFLFLIVGFATILSEREDFYLWVYLTLLLSALISICYAFFQPGGINYGSSNGLITVGRFADQLMVLAIGTIVSLFDHTFRRRIKKIGVTLLGLCFILFTLFLILTAQRGSWIGFIIGIVVLLIFFRGGWKKSLGLIAILLMFSVFFGARFYKDMVSIVDLEHDPSNEVRIQLWISGVDFLMESPFLGHGSDSIENSFKTFFQNKSSEYKSRFPAAEKFPGNMHNSYLQILVESGGGVFVLLICFYLVLLRHIYMNDRKFPCFNTLILSKKILLVVSPGFLVSQFFHGDLFSYGGVSYLIVLGCALAPRKSL